MYAFSILNNCARAHLAWKQLTLQNHLNLYEVITWIHGYYPVPNDNVQLQFVYFIVAICCNTFKSQFLWEKAIWNLHSYFYQWHAPNTKKSDICHWVFNLLSANRSDIFSSLHGVFIQYLQSLYVGTSHQLLRVNMILLLQAYNWHKQKRS